MTRNSIILFHFLFFIFSQTAFTAEPETHSKSIEDVEEYARQIDFNTLPSAVIGGSVNVMTGDYFEIEDDISTLGSNPFTLTRYYSSGSKHVGELYDMWDLNLVNKAQVHHKSSNGHVDIKIHQGSSVLKYYGNVWDNYLSLSVQQLHGGIVNIPSPYLSGKNHLANKQAKYFKKDRIEYSSPGGNILNFHNKDVDSDYYYLSHTRCSNGCAHAYDYADNHVSKVTSIGKKSNPISTLDIVRGKNEITVSSEDGRTIVYNISNKSKRNGHKYCLNTVQRNFAPSIEYFYDEKGRHGRKLLTKRALPDFRCLEIEYNNNHKVCALKAPVGYDTNPIEIYRIRYGQNEAWVSDAENYLKRYHWNDEFRLTRISDYSKNGRKYRCDRFFWGESGTRDYTCLKARCMTDAKGNVLFAKTYKYDGSKNILEECLIGNISGNCCEKIEIDENGIVANTKCEKYVKTYTYTENNLVKSEDDGFQRVEYTYYPHTSLMATKIISDCTGIKQRFLYVYDHNAAKEIEVVDDGNTHDLNNFSGITERHITRYFNSDKGVPLAITEGYTIPKTKEEILFKKIEFEYNSQGWITEERTYDAHNQFICAKSWRYNEHGKVIEEVDEAGHTTTYQYDQNDNVIFKQTSNPDFSSKYTYDYSNRLIKEEELYSDGTTLAKSYAYDYRGNRMRATDIYGNSTEFIYDAYNRVIERVLPPLQNGVKPKEIITYNELNHPVMKLDANGFATTISVNIHGKPYYVKYPDDTEERTSYYLNGNIKEIKDAGGCLTTFEYDLFNRKTKESKFGKSGNLLETKQWIYNTFHLLQEIGPDGKSTCYEYDAKGLLISEVKGEQRTTCIYDSMGRQLEKREHLNNGDYRATVVELDIKGQVIEERIQNKQGKIFLKKHYAYDALGKKTHETIFTAAGPSTTITKYNPRGKPSKIIAPDGSETLYHYRYDYIENGQCVPFEQVVDPKGNSLVKIYNTQDGLAIEERRDPLNQTTQKSTFTYDAAGHLILRTEDIIADGKTTESVRTAFEHDPKGRETAVIEAQHRHEQKTTRREYNHFDQVTKIIKPDGMEIYYTYDVRGRLTYLKSSDGSIHYYYRYDHNNNIVSATDLISKNSTRRTYDSNNHMLTELLENGLKLEYEYDTIGRLTKLTLPDDTAIDYSYDAGYLRAVSRTKDGQTFTHKYEYDTSGKRKSVELPNDLGSISYTYDSCLRLIGVHSAFWQMQGEYDNCGNAISIRQTDPFGQVVSIYEYDDLNQLVAEEGVAKHVYRFDSLGNRVEKDSISYSNNFLNQLKQQNETGYTYDLNGSLISKVKSGEKTNYTYDPLGRLTEVCAGIHKTTYHYDPFHRRNIKTNYVYTDNQWVETGVEQYLYQGDKEIGAVNKNGEIFQLRIMGTGHKGDIGAAVLMELNGKTYIPLHDYRGNVCVLLDTTGKVAETYRYTAFGEETVSEANPKNPWRFSSKRVDPETGWSYFGARHYDPEVGRWTTPDPLWFVDGTNLYAYVRNQPTKFIDPDGLFLEALCEILMNTVTSLFEWATDHDFTACYTEEGGLRMGVSNCYNDCKHSADHKSHSAREQVSSYGPVCATFINGIFTNPKEAMAHRQYIKDNFLPDVPINAVYNATHGLWDLAECPFNLLWCNTRPVEILHMEWDHYFKNCPEGGIIIHYCHSHGAILTRNALESYDPELRKRIHVIAVAPAAYIPREYCGSVMHYVSVWDFVPWADPYGRWMCDDTVRVLSRHPDESYWDHGFQSKTYREEVNRRTQFVLTRQGVLIK